MTAFSRRLIAVPALFVVLAASLAARAQSEDLIPNDPAVRTGELGNGLTYYVRANDKPAGMAELRLVVRAGSALEDDDQLGLAHFVEHMLFNGTENYPGSEIVDVLESFGMEFGPEINAYTSFEETVYRLRVSTEDDNQFDLGLEVLEEWAFNATFDDDQIEKERGVIREEWRVGRGAEARMQDETYPVLFHGSRYAERRPIGDMDIVATAPPETLRRFYDDWYRPDLMAVIAVGDFDPDETVRLIAGRFGRHAGPENPRPRPEFRIPGHDETLVKVVHDPEATQTSVQVFVKYDPPKARFRPELERDLAESLFYGMLNDRLSELSRSGDSPFLYGYGFSTPYTPRTSLAGLIAGVREDSVIAGLESVLIEAERARRYGFTDSELKRAKDEFSGWFENYWKQRDDMESSSFIDPLKDAFLLGDSYPSVDWQWEAVQDLLPGITLEEVQAVAETLLSEESRVVLVKGPSVPSVTDLSEDDIRSVLAGTRLAELDPWEDDAVSGPLVPDPPESGIIVSRSEIPGTGVLSWVLSNGAVVLLKTTDFTSDEILFRAVSPGGTSLVDDADYVSARYAADAVSQGGLGGYSLVDLQKILAGKTVEVAPFINETYEGLSGSASKDDLEDLMELIYLHHVAPRKDEEAWDSFMRRTAESLRNRASSPTTLYEDLVWETVYDDHPRIMPMTLEDLNEADLGRALDIYRDRFSDAGDFTYIFVGDVTPGELEPLVERWIASLPSSVENGARIEHAGYGSAETWRDRGLRNVDGVREVSLAAGAEPLSVVTQVWTGDWDGSFFERYMLQSLASALEMMFTKTLREESGGTYSVGVYSHLSSVPHTDYRIIVRYSCDPQRVDELTDRAAELVAEWREAPPEDKYAADIAANQRRSFAENLERNSWWLGQIAFAVVTDQDVQDMLDRPALYDTLTSDALSSTARLYMDDADYVEAVLYPEE